jgi:signal peptide peptidase SppA
MVNLNLLLGRPWAVTAELADFAQRFFEAEGVAQLRAFAAIKSEAHARTPGPSKSEGSVVVIPVTSVLTARGGTVNSAETTSAFGLADTMRAAAMEKSIHAIVLEVDSPGGEVYGIAEAAAAIREARAAKPVVSVATALAASAGYWLFSQADEGFVTPSGEVGSIGVYGLHEDRSKAMETAGRKVTLVSAGKYKVERAPFGPLSEEALGAMQADVDRYYEMFVKDVAKGRRAKVEQVRSGFGEGRLVGASAAVTAGMADRVGTLDDAIRRAMVLARDRRDSASAMATVQAERFRRERA